MGKEGIIRYGKVDDLIKLEELKGRIPAVIAIPGELHFTEEEFLQGLVSKPVQEKTAKKKSMMSRKA